MVVLYILHRPYIFQSIPQRRQLISSELFAYVRLGIRARLVLRKCECCGQSNRARFMGFGAQQTQFCFVAATAKTREELDKVMQDVFGPDQH